MGRKLSFWLAVGGVSILANVGLTAAAAQTKSPGLARLAALAHSGAK